MTKSTREVPIGESNGSGLMGEDHVGFGESLRAAMIIDARINACYTIQSRRERTWCAYMGQQISMTGSCLGSMTTSSSFPKMDAISNLFVFRVAMHVRKTMTGWSTRTGIN